MTARIGAISATIAAVLALSACLPPLDQVSPVTDEAWPGGDGSAGGPSATNVYDQIVVWRDCGSLECATVQVPLDWSEPDGQRIQIEINRYRAPFQEDRLGSILINPGGPGGSGLQLTSRAADFSGDELLKHYDIVGFDPRGVGASSPVRCGDAGELTAFYLTDVESETEQDLADQIAATEAFAARCRELTGPLIAHVDTASAARDMDVIRAVVGDDKLNFLGFSYGTQLGATYAALYPENTGRMVLDGAVDFLLPPDEFSENQAQGFELALENYIKDCISNDLCPLPRDVELAKRTIRDLVIEARDEGFPSNRGEVNGTIMVYGIVATLYNEDNWPFLSEAIDEALNVGTADTFLYLADFYFERDEDGNYLTNGSEAFTAINCLDQPEQPAWTIEELRAFKEEAEEASPTFGWWFAGSTGCDGWPWTANTIIDDLTPAQDAGDLLVIGTTGDPATPIEWARSLSRQLGNAALLVYDGEGHTAYGRSNQCIIDEVDAYFVDGTLPEDGKVC